MASTFVAFPSNLQAALQSAFLNREFEEGLDSVLAYRRMALQQTINARIGETLTRTRKGRNAPQINPISGANINLNLDNSLTPSTYSIEQYTITLNQYADTQDVNIMEELAGIADQAIAASRNNGVEAAQVLERLAKIQLFASYNGGNTYVRSDLGTNTTTTVYVDDIRGFQYTSVNGVLTPVSSTYPLTCYEYKTTVSGVNQSFNVTGAAAAGVSLFPGSNGAGTTDGVAGYLTITGAGLAPVNGDAIIAANAAYIVRPGGKYSTNELTSTDVLTWGNIMDAVTYLRNAGVPALPNGTYACILDNASLRHLFADQQFSILFAASSKSKEYVAGDIFELWGVTFIPTTEAYVQQPNGTDLNVVVRRPIVIGAEAIIQGNFEGMEMWLSRRGVEGNSVSDVMLVNNVAQVLRVPLDRLQQVMSMSWQWVGGFACPTDLTANSSIIPTIGNNLTGGNPLYKRAVIIETAG